jgi:hypothetical protein
MNLLKKIGQTLFGGSSEAGGQDRDGIYFYVKCGKCGAPVRIRADKRHDLSRDMDGGGYILRKEIMDDKCFRLMYATLRFDAGYHIVDRTIEGGEFISPETYEALTQPPAETSNETTSEE